MKSPEDSLNFNSRWDHSSSGHSVRFDRGALRAPERKSDGRLFCEATFAKAGILEYKKPDGSVWRELRLPETNKDSTTLESYAAVPVTIEHPPTLLNSRNAKQFMVGVTDTTTRFDPEGGYVRGVVILYDEDGIQYSKDGIEVSAGYTCDVDRTPGTWKGQHYDAIQTNVRVNHVALTRKGRAGPDVRLHLDSSIDVGFEVDSSMENTAAIRIDGVEYSGIPPTVASVVGRKLSDLEAKAAKYDAMESSFQAIEREKEELENLYNRERGRGDALEIELEEIRFEQLERQDGCGDKKHKGKKKMMDEEEYEEDEDEDEYEDEEEEELPPKKKKKMVADSVQAWLDAETLVPGIVHSDAFDPDLDVAEIQRLVLETLKPDLDLSYRDDSYIEARYDALLEEVEEELLEEEEEYEEDEYEEDDEDYEDDIEDEYEEDDEYEDEEEYEDEDEEEEDRTDSDYYDYSSELSRAITAANFSGGTTRSRQLEVEEAYASKEVAWKRPGVTNSRS